MSEELIALYKKAVEDGSENFFGLSILQHKEHIGLWCKAHEARTLLDVGCGRGDAYRYPHVVHVAWGIAAPYLYDPAFSTHDVFPAHGRTFDAVICSDVLEHLYEHEVEAFIGELFMRADKFVWASVCCRKAKKEFPDGRNMHMTIRGIEWWRDKFERVSMAVSRHRFNEDRRVNYALVENA